MNLEFDPHQHAIIRTTADLCRRARDACGAEGATIDRDALAQFGAVGVIGLRHPEPTGSGLTAVESVLVAEECGAALGPTPLLIWADLAGAEIAGGLDGSTAVTGASSGDRTICYGPRADVVILLDPDGPRAIETGEIGWAELTSPDPTISRWAIRSLPTGAAIGDAATSVRWAWQSRLLAAAHLVGVARGAIELAVAHAGQRHQFGQPIGAFQAVKHLLADVYTATELARSHVLFAAVCWATDEPNAPDQSAAAMILAARAALAASRTAIQIHGGIGFTAESRPHLYYKRCLLLEADFGPSRRLAPGMLHRDLALIS